MFLPKGVDVCAITSGFGYSCFSPDNVATWVFCAYHGSYTFSDIGNVFYTVEPYGDVFGVINGAPNYACDVGQQNPALNTAPTPNGVLVDSMSNMLSHETFETITDPGPAFTGWWSFNSPSLLSKTTSPCKARVEFKGEALLQLIRQNPFVSEAC